MYIVKYVFYFNYVVKSGIKCSHLNKLIKLSKSSLMTLKHKENIPRKIIN